MNDYEEIQHLTSSIAKKNNNSTKTKKTNIYYIK